MASEARNRWSLVGGGVIAAVGLLLVGVTVVHLLNEHPDPLTLALGGGIPLLVSLGTVAGGLWIARCDLAKRDVVRLLGWWSAGVLVTGLMGVVLIVYERSHGVTLVDTVYVVLNNATAGAAGGLLVGYFEMQNRRRAEQIAQERERLAGERERLADERERLAVLNRVVRHDIRNDMSVVLGWLGELEGHVDEDGREALDRVQTASEHVVELTKIARDYVEVAVGDSEFDLEPTPLGDVLRNEIHTRRETYPDATFSLDDDLPAVDVRANELLGSVFRNVLNNAVQHNDEATPVVDVSVEREDGSVRVEIADNGPGIPDERKERVFGKGEQRLDSAGTGIGLFLVDTLVAEYGGDVWIEDNEPTGSVVVVRLPVA